MENTFEEIRRQIHDIRNFLAPFDFKLASLDERIAAMRLSIDERLGGFESKLLVSSFKVEEQGLKLADLCERVRWIELILKIPARPTRRTDWPPETETPDPGAQ